eukprot:6213847-Pleurochrysis_carterae.AAC.2
MPTRVMLRGSCVAHDRVLATPIAHEKRNALEQESCTREIKRDDVDCTWRRASVAKRHNAGTHKVVMKWCGTRFVAHRMAT